MLRVPKYALAHRIFVLYCNKTTKKDAESLPRPHIYLALTTSFQNPYSKTIKPSMQLIIPDIHSAGYIFRLFRVIIEITIPINENNGSKNITSI